MNWKHTCNEFWKDEFLCLILPRNTLLWSQERSLHTYIYLYGRGWAYMQPWWSWHSAYLHIMKFDHNVVFSQNSFNNLAFSPRRYFTWSFVLLSYRRYQVQACFGDFTLRLTGLPFSVSPWSTGDTQCFEVFHNAELRKTDDRNVLF